MLSRISFCKCDAKTHDERLLTAPCSGSLFMWTTCPVSVVSEATRIGNVPDSTWSKVIRLADINTSIDTIHLQQGEQT